MAARNRKEAARGSRAVRNYFATTSRKVMLLLYAASLIVGVAILVQSHRGGKQAEQQRAMARLAGVSGTLAAQLDGNRINRLLDAYDSRGMLVKNTQDAWYYVLHGALLRSRQAAGLEAPLAILAFDTLKQELQIVATSAERPALRDAYTGPGAAQAQQFLRSPAHQPVRAALTGNLVAIDPVVDRTGHVVGAVLAYAPLAPLEAASHGGLLREVAIVILLFGVIGALLFRRVGLLVRREEQDHEQLQRRHAGVTDSIAYAGKIQSALIPPAERYREQFDDFFVLNKPRDMVSGDFHWYHRISAHECLVAAADCTGHGLPGAMIAAIACSLLNDLGREMASHDPGELLAELNRRMIRTLHQEGHRSGAGDGMDIALCRINRHTRELLFAGAFRPLYWMHQGTLRSINGERMPVGGSQHGLERRFTTHRLTYAAGDSIYLFSDGYVDQFGGPQRRKFMASRLNQILAANQGKPMAAQAEALDQAFMEWKGTLPQVDDVCMLGIAV